MERKKVHIGLFRQYPLDSTDEALEKALVQSKKRAKEIQDYYRYFDINRRWDIQVRAYSMRGEANAHPPGYASTDIKKYIAEHPEEFVDVGWNPNYWHVHGGYSPSYCGQGNRPGYTSVTYLHYACGVKTMLHELGHNFGWHHASTLTGDELVEYGDSTCIMGSGSVIVGLNSVNLLRVNFETEREIKKLDKTQQFLLAPIELSHHVLRDGEYQHVVTNEREPYHISLRKVKGATYGPGYGAVEQTVYIIQSTSDQHSIRISPDLQPGTSTTLPNGVKVEYLEYINETARLNVYVKADDPRPDDIPMPTGFPATIPSVYLSPEHSGSWYDNYRSGQGFDIHIKEDKMVFYWYTFNRTNVSRRFYFATCPVGEGIEEFDLFTTEDGTWEDPTIHKLVPAGKGQLYFFDGTHGIFNFDTPEHGRGSVEITPVALSSNHASNGTYYQESRTGEGFTVQFFDTYGIDRCAAYWYSYGPKLRGSIPGGGQYVNQTQRWYSCEGTKNENGTYDLTVYELQDGTWMGFTSDTPPLEVGTAKISVIDEANITFDYTINADQVTGTGTFDLTRLF